MAFEIFHLIGRINYEGDAEVIDSLEKTDRLLVRAHKHFEELGTKVSRVGRRIGDTFQSVKRRVLSLQGAIAGVGVGYLIHGFIDASSAAEGYRTRLDRILGSQAESNRLFSDMAALAARVPFEYEKIMESATSLAGVMEEGREEVNKWMPVILDISATSGLALEETTSNFIRMYSAGAASADMFRERGILSMLGFKAGVSYSAEETRKKLWEEWEKADSRFRGATGDMADDWEGLTSMMGDRWFQFREKVGRAGLFDAAKQGIQGVLDKLDELDEKGDLDRIAEGISDAILQATHFIGGVLIGMGRAVSFVSDNPLIAEYGLIGFFLLGKKGAVTLAAVGAIMEEIMDRPVSALEHIESRIEFITGIIEQLEKRQEMLQRRIDSPLYIDKDRARAELESVKSQLEDLNRELKTWQLTLETNREGLAETGEAAIGFGGALIQTGQWLQQFTDGLLRSQRAARDLKDELEPPPPPPRPTLPGPEIEPAEIPDEVRILTFWERIGMRLGETLERAEDLEALTSGILLTSFKNLGNAIESVFSAAIDGSQAAGRAFVSNMLGALAAVARGFGEFFLQEAAGALGEFLLRKDPSKLVAARTLTAAALGMFALAGALGGLGNAAAAGGGGGGGAVPSSPESYPPSSEIHIWIDPFDPSNPVHQAAASEAVYRYGERGGRFQVHLGRY